MIPPLFFRSTNSHFSRKMKLFLSVVALTGALATASSATSICRGTLIKLMPSDTINSLREKYKLSYTAFVELNNRKINGNSDLIPGEFVCVSVVPIIEEGPTSTKRKMDIDEETPAKKARIEETCDTVCSKKASSPTRRNARCEHCLKSSKKIPFYMIGKCKDCKVTFCLGHGRDHTCANPAPKEKVELGPHARFSKIDTI
jgi:hypothetical protein